MRWTLTSLACLVAACATASVESAPIAGWAGAYDGSEPIYRSQSVGGVLRDSYVGSIENVLEIRPTGPMSARIDFMMFYPRGHQCALSAPAELKDGRLEISTDDGHGTCRVSISRRLDRNGADVLDVAVDRELSTDCSFYCGANARLGATIPVSSRKAAPKTPITELE